ncbi:MAG: caspase family protein [Gemmataceae bacterium]|nr:caspase family protein [Gemmataceae bacterium]
MTRFLTKQRTSWPLAVLAALLLATSASAQGPRKPSLYLLAVGVSEHRERAMNNGVRFAAKDALDVASLFRSQQGRLFANVEALTLTNAQATRPNILKGLAWLAQKARPDDYVMVFLSGHGGTDQLGNYTYFTHDAHPLLASTHLPGKLVQEALGKMPGKRFLVLDTCHAAGAVGAGEKALPQGSGFVTFASCLASEQSGEAAGNGFFTRAFLEGLRGQADTNRDGTVTLAELDAYVAERVQVLTRGQQQTTVQRPASIQSRLPLAVVGGQFAQGPAELPAPLPPPNTTPISGPPGSP